MKQSKNKILKNLFFILSIALLNACGAIEQNRIRTSVLNDPLTPESIKSSIKEGKITIGMTKEQIIAAWGPLVVIVMAPEKVHMVPYGNTIHLAPGDIALVPEPIYILVMMENLDLGLNELIL